MSRWNESADYYRRSLEISRTRDIREDVARDLQDIGGALLDAGKPREALRLQNEALAIYHSVEIDEKKAFVPVYSVLLSDISRAYYGSGNKSLAVFFGKRAVNAIQGERQRLSNLDPLSQKNFLEKNATHYRRLAEWLIAEGRFFEAAEVLKMLKEDEYSNFVRRDPEEIKNLSRKLDTTSRERPILEKYLSFADNVSKIGAEYEMLKEEEKAKGPGFTRQSRLKELGDKLKSANEAFQIFLDKELVKEFDRIPKRDVRRDLEQLERQRQGDLKEWKAVSVYTLVGEERYRVFLTTPNIQIDGRQEIPRAKLNEKIFAFRDALQDPKTDPRFLGKELYDILIKPIEKQIKESGAKTVLFSLDGALRYLPVGALWDGEKYMAEEYQIVLLTAAGAANINKPVTNDWKIFGGGVSEAANISEPEKASFRPLRGVTAELDSIIRENDDDGFFPGKIFANENFTADILGESVGSGNFNILHVATHFKLGRDNSVSFLLLGNNRALTLREISARPDFRVSKIEIVVLSACETALSRSGVGTEGGEVDSSAAFFESRGAKSVIASLWSVEDTSTSQLMIEFYRVRRENPGTSKAEALRRVQMALMRGKYKDGEIPSWRGVKIVTGNSNQPAFKTDENAPFAHPYYWSPFVLSGNWR